MSDAYLIFSELNDSSLLLSYTRGAYRYSTQGMSKYMRRPFVTYSLNQVIMSGHYYKHIWTVMDLR
jgi:hypothetical protein